MKGVYKYDETQEEEEEEEEVGAASNTTAVLWMMMSYPLFWLVSRDFLMFQALLVCYAVIWGLAFGFLLPMLLQRFRKLHS